MSVSVLFISFLPAIIWVLLMAKNGGLDKRSSNAESRTVGNKVAWVAGRLLVLFALLLALLLGTFVFSSYQQARVVEPEPTANGGEPIGVVSSEPIDVAWEQFNRSKIPLDADQPKPVAEVAAVEVSAASEADEQPEAESAKPAKTDEPAAEKPPEWVVHPPKRVGNTYRQVVVSGPFSTVDQCHHALEEKLRLAVQERLASQFSADSANQHFSPTSFRKMNLPLDYILREICRDEYVETVDASFGEMKQVHVLMEFDASIMQHLSEMWRNLEMWERLQTVVVLAIAALLLLTLVYGFLKIDTWTRGYYTKQLLLGVPVVAIGLWVLWRIL